MTDLSPQTTAALEAAGLDPTEVVDLIRRALAEDVATGDLTSEATIAAHATLACAYVSRRTGVVAGLPVVSAVVDLAGPDVTFTPVLTDGDRIEPGSVLARIEGNARQLLTLERTSLNVLTHLSGIATVTRAWADAVADTNAKVRDTRKTVPGLRHLEKYAVRCGGGVNHRIGLWDAVLVKDNHVAAAGGVGQALDAVRAHLATLPHGGEGIVVQIEVDGLDQLSEALDHGATQVLIDNFTTADSVAAVALVHERAPHVLIEASGGLTFDRAHEVAATGVDFLAVGALTHSAPTLDIGLDAL